MATAAHTLTFEKFERLYATEKPYYEYLDGQAVQKKAPTILHGYMQIILGMLFDMAGYRSASEVELRISPDWRPKPDVIASLSPMGSDYPVHAVEIVAEVLSEGDSMLDIFNRCEHYQEFGFQNIFIVDPENRRVWEWDALKNNTERISELKLTNGKQIPATQLWEELDRRLA